MNLIAIDTSTEACSVAIQFNGKLYADFDICPQSHSILLLPMVDKLLKESGAKLTDFDALVYGRGPGSFTGVRIGIGVAQGLAFSAELPTVGISTMQAMAQQAYQEHNAEQCIVAIDARMSEVYCAKFKVVGGVMAFDSEEAVMPPEKFVENFSEQGASFAAGTGWQSYYKHLSALQANDDIQVQFPDARYMLALAEKEVVAGNTQTAENAQPVYVRDTVSWKKLPGRE